MKGLLFPIFFYLCINTNISFMIIHIIDILYLFYTAVKTCLCYTLCCVVLCVHCVVLAVLLHGHANKACLGLSLIWRARERAQFNEGFSLRSLYLPKSIMATTSSQLYLLEQFSFLCSNHALHVRVVEWNSNHSHAPQTASDGGWLWRWDTSINKHWHWYILANHQMVFIELWKQSKSMSVFI